MTTMNVNIPAYASAFGLEGPAPRLAEWLARAIIELQSIGLESIGNWLRMPAPAVPEAAAQLLRLAEAYDATQPSYAADLRAAALMSQRD
ncbi:MAG TPA: hypothetical protein PLG92_17380 [Piscinibacter sp.]|uniref:hypothetical protein n=1 Tax=Piscinibacter sp. TaxID=1903157 RepID=UPI002CBB7F23|nr:hypothetical protein [Piscinibacter sp.]